MNKPLKRFPLRHRFGFHFTLQEFESAHTHLATYLPLIVSDQGRREIDADVIQVNPSNDNFEASHVQTPACFMNSVVNKMKISEYCSIPPEIDMPDNIYWKALVTFGLGDIDVVATDGTTLAATLLFTKGADNIMPAYQAFDLEHANLMPADIDTLDTTQILESINMAPNTLRDNLGGELGPKIRKMVDGPYINRVHKDYPYFNEKWYNMPGQVKRMNQFVGCYLYVGMNSSMVDGATTAASNQLITHFDDRLTIEEESLDFHFLVEFNEWNDHFDQSP